jgi:acetyltransferase-like isoleucine patch superfamily enzyme
VVTNYKLNIKQSHTIRVLFLDSYVSLKNFKDILKFKLKFKHATIIKPLEIKYSTLDNVFISKNVVIMPNIVLRILFDCKLYVGENTYIGAYSHIAGTKNVIIIGKNVQIADRVFISTVDYRYDDITKPIKEQGLQDKGSVIISDECWIGIGVSILSGVKIGRHTIVGANSVVTRSIPPYSVAVGSPARVIKRYDFHVNKWLPVRQ